MLGLETLVTLLVVGATGAVTREGLVEVVKALVDAGGEAGGTLLTDKLKAPLERQGLARRVAEVVGWLQVERPAVAEALLGLELAHDVELVQAVAALGGDLDGGRLQAVLEESVPAAAGNGAAGIGAADAVYLALLQVLVDHDRLGPRALVLLNDLGHQRLEAQGSRIEAGVQRIEARLGGATTVPQSPVRVGLPPSLGEGFVERAEVAELEALLGLDGTGAPSGRAVLQGPRAVAWGGGGLGKTRLAIEVARRHVGAFPKGVIHARVEDRRPEDVWVDLAADAAFPWRELEAEDAAAQLLLWLEGGGALIVLDDVQGRKAARRWAGMVALAGSRRAALPAGCAVVLTTRLRGVRLGGTARSLAVGRLDQEQAVALLRRRAGVRGAIPGEVDLVARLHHHPLALVLAGQWLGHLGPEEGRVAAYLARIEEAGALAWVEEIARAAEEEGQEAEAIGARTVAACFAVGLAQLEAAEGDLVAEHALAMLDRLAWAQADTPIAVALLDGDSDALREGRGASDATARAARRLVDLGLAEGDGAAVRTHPLVGEWLHTARGKAGLLAGREALAEALFGLFPNDFDMFHELRPGGRSPVTVDEDLLGHLRAVGESEGPPNRWVAHVSMMLADWTRQFGRLRQAVDRWTQVLGQRQALCDLDPDHTGWQRDLSVSHNMLGDLARDAGDTDTARHHFDAALAIAERLAAADPHNATWQRDLSVSHNKLGDLARAAGDTDTARHHFDADLAIAERLAAADPHNATWQRDLSVSHNKLGDLARDAGDTDTARRHYDASLAIAERLAAADPHNAAWQRDLSVSHNRLGDLARDAGDTDAARRHFDAALAIRERLAAADPHNATWQRDLSVSHDRLGDLARDAGDTDTARRHFDAALAIAERLAAADPHDAARQRDLSVSHSMLGDLARDAGDTDTARHHYDADLAIAERLAASDPHNAVWQFDLVVSLFRIDTPDAYRRAHTILTTLDAAGRLAPPQRQWIAIAAARGGLSSAD